MEALSQLTELLIDSVAGMAANAPPHVQILAGCAAFITIVVSLFAIHRHRRTITNASEDNIAAGSAGKNNKRLLERADSSTMLTPKLKRRTSERVLRHVHEWVSALSGGTGTAATRSRSRSSSRHAKEDRGRRRYRRRDRLLRAAKSMIGLGEEVPERATLRRQQPTSFLLRSDEHGANETALASENNMSAASRLTLKSMRVFGSFGDDFFTDLCSAAQPVTLGKGDVLFAHGSAIDAMYIVQSGSIELHGSEPGSSTTTSSGSATTDAAAATAAGSTDNKHHVPTRLITIFRGGEVIASLLSILGHLTDAKVESPSQLLEARAAEEGTVVIQLPYSAFTETVSRHPHTFSHLLQTIAIHLQRVSFVALYKFLGLTKALITPPKNPCVPPNLQGLTVDAVESPGASRDGVLAACLEAIGEALALAPYKGDQGGQQKDPVADPAVLAALSAHAELQVHSTPGHVLIRQGETTGAGLYFVAAGALSTSLAGNNEGREAKLFDNRQGSLAGELQIVSSFASFITLRVTEPSVLVHIPADDVRVALATYPILARNLTKLVLSHVSPLVLQADFIINWNELESGERLYRQGDTADSTYIILHGRVRSVREDHTGRRHLVREYGRNDMVGDLEVITESTRATSTHAVRDTEIAKVPAGLLHLIRRRHPEIMTRLMRSMGEIALHAVENPLGAQRELQSSNLSTVALIPVNGRVPLTAFSAKLVEALRVYGSALRLDRAFVEQAAGIDPNSENGDRFQLTRWLGGQENKNDIVVYVADDTPTAWTRRCLRQADIVFAVGCGHHEPESGGIEGMIEDFSGRSQKELVLLHKHSVPLPSRTAEWLNIRSYCSGHHHLRCPRGFFGHYKAKQDGLSSSSEEAVGQEEYLTTLPSASETDEEYGDDNREAAADDAEGVFRDSEGAIELTDFGRLARRILGLSVAVVLGGGGARGITQIGAIRALEESGIPIDIVGGTSIGSFVGALYAEERGYHGTTLRRRARSFAKRMGNTLSLAFDLTYPVTAMLTGRAFNDNLRNVFGVDIMIEDLWIPYFCVSTDVTTHSKAVHRFGPLWKYVRASMSLSGYLPPICDPSNGHLLLDGGYVDILPISEVEPMRPNRIIGIDVSGADNQEYDDYGDELSGWWVLWRRLTPFGRRPKVPEMQEIASRLAFITGIQQIKANRQKLRGHYTYLRPPIDGIGVLDWHKFDYLEHMGYDSMHAIINSWAEEPQTVEESGMATRENISSKRTKNRRGRSPPARGLSPLNREPPRFNSLTSF